MLLKTETAAALVNQLKRINNNMRIHEIITESKELDEVSPTSLASKAGWKQLGNKFMGALGSQTAKAKSDVGSRATQLYKAFNDYALRTGIPLNRVPFDSLTKWAKTQGLKAPNLDAFKTGDVTRQGVLNLSNPKVSQNIWASMAQDAYRAAYNPDKLGAEYGVPQKAQKKPVKKTAAKTTAEPVAPAATTGSTVQQPTSAVKDPRKQKLEKIINVIQMLPKDQKVQVARALNFQE